LLPNSRIILMALLSANLCLPLVLAVWSDSEVVAVTAGEVFVERDFGPTIEIDSVLPEAECRVWGPVDTPTAFAGTISRLEALGSLPVINQERLPSPSNYLVYLSGFDDAEDLRVAQQDLRRRKVDHSVLGDGTSPRTISVGVFSRQALALRQREKLENYGYKASINEITKQETVYNLTANVAVETDLYKSSSSGCLAFAHNR